MLYLLDANVLITANNSYYPLRRIPEFWDWLVNCGIQGQVKIPLEMYDEIDGYKDDLTFELIEALNFTTDWQR